MKTKLSNKSLGIICIALAILLTAETVIILVARGLRNDTPDLSAFTHSPTDTTPTDERTSLELFDLAIAYYCASQYNLLDRTALQLSKQEYSVQLFIEERIISLLCANEQGRARLAADTFKGYSDTIGIAMSVARNQGITVDQRVDFLTYVIPIVGEAGLVHLGNVFTASGEYEAAYICYYVADPTNKNGYLNGFDWKKSGFTSKNGDHTEKYEYDMFGRLILEEVTDYGITTVTEYSYDTHDRIIATNSVMNVGGFRSGSTYYYLPSGQIDRIESKETNDSVDHDYVTVYTYDTAGRPTNISKYYKDTMAESIRETYYYEGNLTYYEKVNAQDNYYIDRKNYQYDEFGRLISETTIKGARTTYAYDESGRLIKRSLGTINYNYNYDVFGNLVTVTLAGGTADERHEYVCIYIPVATPDVQEVVS